MRVRYNTIMGFFGRVFRLKAFLVTHYFSFPRTIYNDLENMSSIKLLLLCPLMSVETAFYNNFVV